MKLTANQVTAVVLAGGFGTRVQHLLPNVPKPMAAVNGRPFLEWVLAYLAGQGLDEAILSTGHLAESIERHFKAAKVSGISVHCVRETQPLGTAGGFLNAIRDVSERPEAWLVLNGDSLALAQLDELFDCLSDSRVSGAILGVPMPDASRYGTIEMDATGDLISFKEKQPGPGAINAGVYLFRASAVESFPHRVPLSFEKDVFPELIASGMRLKVCVTQAPFLDIGTPESLHLADAFVRQHAGFFREKKR